MRSQTTRTIAGRVNPDGSIAQTAGGFTVQKGGTGVYTLKFPGSRLIGISGATAQAQDLLIAFSGFAGDSVNVTGFNASANVVGDINWIFVATVAA